MSDPIVDNIFQIPKEIVFPDELNNYLKNQLTVLSQENAILRTSLEKSNEKRQQIEQIANSLKKKFKNNNNNNEDLNNNNNLPTFATNVQINANSKIVELSKNYREKCAELEKYKTKCSKLLTIIEDFEQEKKSVEELKDIESVTNKIIPGISKNNNEDLAEINKVLLEKLKATTNKLSDFRNLNAQLKQQIRQLNKLLQQETGLDLNFIVQNINSNNNNWKGRSELISELQEKNRKLKEKLEKLILLNQHPNNVPVVDKVSSKICLLETENAILKTQFENLKTKNEILNSRCKMLQAEQQSFKERIQEFKDRSNNDVELIENISKQLAEAEHVKRCVLKEKDLEINKLRQQIQKIEEQNKNFKKFIDDVRNKELVINEKNPKVVEKSAEKNLNFLELFRQYKRKLEQERNEHEKTQHVLGVERQKSLKLELAMAKSELEVASFSRKTGYSNKLSQSSKEEDNLRNQLELLEESNKALKTKLEIEQKERQQDLEEFAKVLIHSADLNK